MIFGTYPIREAGFYEFRRVGETESVTVWCYQSGAQVFLVRSPGQPWPLVAHGWEWRRVVVPEGVPERVKEGP